MKKEKEKVELFDLAKEDKNGFVDMKKVYETNPDLKTRLVGKLKNKQEMIIDSITEQDLISANLREKAVSSRVLGEEVLDIEVGRSGSGVNIILDQRPIYAGLSVKSLEEPKDAS